MISGDNALLTTLNLPDGIVKVYAVLLTPDTKIALGHVVTRPAPTSYEVLADGTELVRATGRAQKTSSSQQVIVIRDHILVNLIADRGAPGFGGTAPIAADVLEDWALRVAARLGKG